MVRPDALGEVSIASALDGDGTTRVLLVDDEPDYLLLVERELESALDHAEFYTATSAQDAHDIVAEFPIDCIVSDYQMPRQDGISFLKEIRQTHSGMPFILFTSEGSERVARRAISAGVNDYIMKGANNQYEALANAITSSIQKHELEKSHVEMAKSASKLRAILDSTPHAMFIVDASGKVLDVNTEAEKASNASSPSLCSSHISEIIEVKDQYRSIDNYLDPHSRSEFEAYHRTARGSKYSVRVEINQINHPAIDQYVVLSKDISEQKSYEKAITALNRTGMAFLQTQTKTEVAEIAMDAASSSLSLPIAGIWFYDDATETLEPVVQTPELAAAVGPQPTLERDSKAGHVWQAGEASIFEKPLSEHYPEDTRISAEMLFPLGEFGVLAVPVTDERLYHPEQVTMAHLLATNVERALTQADREMALRAEKRFFSESIDTVDDLIFTIDESNTLIRWNKMVESVHESVADDGGPPALENLFATCDTDTPIAQLTEAFDTGKSRLTTEIGTQGDKRMFQFQASRMQLPSQDGCCLVVVGRNITALAQKQQELRHHNERLEKFSSVVSHDLRNPLQIATGHLQFLKDEVPEEKSSHYNAVDNAHGRMLELIEDLLALAKRGNQATDISWLDLETKADSCWEVVQSSEASLNTNVGRLIKADGAQLKHLLENLLANSVRHGGSDVTISVGTTDDGFYIEDDGVGIPESKRDDIFNTGYTTDDDGTGIGLMIVKDIATQHGWEITVSESDAGGARFAFANVKTDPKRPRASETDAERDQRVDVSD